MSTMENLFAQIFERKDRIIEQMQQHADSYTQQLASRLLIDGITPPPWLLSPNSNSHSSDPNQLEKDKIISRLLRPPRASTRYSTHRPAAAGGNERLSNVTCMGNRVPNKSINVSNEPMATCDTNEIACLNCVSELDDNVKSSTNAVGAKISSIHGAPDMSLECYNNDIVCSLNRVAELDDNVESPVNEDGAKVSSIHGAPDMSLECHNNDIGCSINHAAELDDNVKSPVNEVGAKISSIHGAPDVSLECHNNAIGCSINRVTEPDDRVGSPQNEINARIKSIYAAPDMSLARIQRSRSRQKARELRSNAKTAAKSCLNNETRTNFSLSDDSKAKKDLHQVSKDNHPFKSDDMTGLTSMTSEEKNKKANDRTSLENDLPKEGSFSDKENLVGGVMVQPTGDSLQQYGPVNRVMEGVNVSDSCLRSHASKMSRTGKIKGTQSQNKPFCGRITRSRSSIQQISGINKFSVGDLMPKVNVSNKLLDAGENSQVLSGRNEDTQAICSNGGVLKQVNSSNVDMKKSSPRANLQENAEIVVGNKPIEAPVVMQPISSGIKLDAVTSDCCMQVKPKQLNFDEISVCDLNEICSPLSKKRKLDGILGQECYPSKESASFVDHKFSPKATTTESCDNSEECAKDEMVNTGLETNENPAVDDVDHNSMVSLHDDIDVTDEVNVSSKEGENTFNEELLSGKSQLKEDHTPSLKMQIKEGDLSHEGEESAAGAFIPVSQNSKSTSISRLTKQANKEFEVSNINLNSAKFNTCPLNQQKNVVYQPNCFSDSRKFMVPIQRDAIHLNLKTPDDDANSVKESASIRSSEKINLHSEMFCNSPEETESLHELKAAEKTVIEVDEDTKTITDTLKQFVNPVINDDIVVTDIDNFETNIPEWVSSYDAVQPSQNDDESMACDDITPVYEGFFIDDKSIARASIIEQICKSESMQTPLSQISSTFNQHQIQDLYGFMADGNHGIIDHIEIGTTVSLDEDSRKHLVTEIESVIPQHQKFSYDTPFYWQSKHHYSSPTGKLWERSASSSSSSEKHLSSNPDLTCFRIEEDPCSNEENENADDMSDQLQETVKVENAIVKVSPKMKVERTGNDYEVAVEIQAPFRDSTEVGSTKSIKYPDIYSSNSVSIEASVPRTFEKVKHKPKVHHGFKTSTYDKENRNSSIVTRASSKGNLSEISRNKSSMRSGIPRSSQKEAKRNNIVSNVTSFIPLVQQKQAAAVCTGKRDIKVKALEAAEAAKRCEQDKENERKMKKEALKVERERMVKEKAKEKELNLIKKQEELKKKEADIAERKRLREEEERKQAAKRRKLAAETQKNKILKFEKTRARKVDVGKPVKNTAIAGNTKKSENLTQNKNAEENSVKKQDTELRTYRSLTNVLQQVESVLENLDASNDFDGKEKATSINEKSPVHVGSGKLTGQENSYDISPYQCSDEEDDEEDDQPTKKFVPSWASKKRVAMVLPLQQELDPESIFTPDSFCSMDEVLLPRRLQAQ